MDALVDALVPGMPPAGPGRRSPRHAQGIPLFAVETVRVADRPRHRPAVEASTGWSATSANWPCPDSLHALLAARLDALDPAVRRLVADAAVLGTTFPAEALIAVSGRTRLPCEPRWPNCCAARCSAVSADPLSPERGS